MLKKSNLKEDEYLVQIDYDTDPGSAQEKIEELLKFLNVKYEIFEEDNIPSVQLLVFKNKQ
jgi:hypothetical protein